MKPKTTQAPRAPLPTPVYSEYRPDKRMKDAQARAARDQPALIGMASRVPNIKLGEN